MIYLLKFFYSWLLPPAIFVLLLLWSAWRLHKKNNRLAVSAGLVAALLYLSSIQPVAEMLLRPLEYKYPLPQSAGGDVIVLLGGGSLADVPLPQGWSDQVTESEYTAKRRVYRRAAAPIRLAATGAGDLGVSYATCGGGVQAGGGDCDAVSRRILFIAAGLLDYVELGAVGG